MPLLQLPYIQLKWVLIEKPSKRDAYVRGIIEEELNELLQDASKTFDDFSSDYVVVFH